MDPQDRVEAVLELIWRVLLRVTIWAALGYLLYRVRSVIAAITIAAVLCYTVLPVVDFLCSYRVRGLGRKPQRFIATLLVFIALFSGVTIAFKACITPFQAEFKGVVQNLDSSNLNTKVVSLRDRAQSWVKDAKDWYQALPPDVQSLLAAQRFDGIGSTMASWARERLQSSVGYLFRLIDVILIPVLAFYFIMDSRTLKREFVALVPRGRAREMLAMLHEVNCIMRSYVIGQIILCLIAGVIVGLMLALFGMQYILILSVFAAITRAIPVVGPVFSGVAIVVLGLAKSPILGLYLLIAFSAMHFIESKFIMPKLIGDRMQLHPAMVIIVLLIGAELFGVMGMFMAAPVAAIVRVLVRYYLIKPKKLHVWGLTHQEHADQKGQL